MLATFRDRWSCLPSCACGGVAAALVFLTACGESNGVDWERVFPSPSGIGNAIAVVEQDAVLVAGSFGSEARFGEHALRASGTSDQGFVVQISADGNPRWARQLEAESSALNAVAVAADGAVSVGFARGVASWGERALPPPLGGADAVILWFEPGSGTAQRSLRFGGAGFDEAAAIAALPDGEWLVVGSFSGTAEFAGQMLSSQGSTDGFVLRLAANGAARWARRLGGIGQDRLATVAVRGDDFALGGAFAGEMTVGGDVLDSTGETDGFVARCRLADGDCVWARGIGSSSADSVTAVQFGSDGMRAAGFVSGPVAISPAGQPDGTMDAFAARWSADGELVFFKRIGGGGADSAEGLLTTATGEAVLVGQLEGTVELDGVTTASATNAADGLVGTVSASGRVETLRALGSDGADVLRATALSAAGDRLLVAGRRGHSPPELEGEGDIYVARISLR